MVDFVCFEYWIKAAVSTIYLGVEAEEIHQVNPEFSRNVFFELTVIAEGKSSNLKYNFIKYGLPQFGMFIPKGYSKLILLEEFHEFLKIFFKYTICKTWQFPSVM